MMNATIVVRRITIDKGKCELGLQKRQFFNIDAFLVPGCHETGFLRVANGSFHHYRPIGAFKWL